MRRTARTDTRASAASSSSKGWAPGESSVTRIGPPEALSRSAGTTPARTSDDLPHPLGPTTATNRATEPGSSRRSTICRTEVVRPKNSGASASVKARSPRYGFRDEASAGVLSVDGNEGDSAARAASANAAAPSASGPAGRSISSANTPGTWPPNRPRTIEPSRRTSSASDGGAPFPIENPVR